MTQRTHRILSSMAVGAAGFFVAASLAHAGFCYTWGCGGNSATVGDGIVFDELNVKPIARASGDVKLISAEVLVSGKRRAVTLNVQGQVLTAIDKLTPATIYRDRQLLDMIFTIAHPDGRMYDVMVTKVCTDKESTQQGCNRLMFWVAPQDLVPYFELKVKKTHMRNPPPPGAPAYNKEDDRPIDPGFKEQLCKGEALTKDELWTSAPNAAIFYEGDHFDPKHKKVSPTVQPDGWFNIACAGAAPAKMHLLRHTTAGSDPSHQTTFPQRTAMLKMITADYCGDGKAWTADGTPLNYADAHSPPWYTTQDFNPTNLDYKKVEAIWGPDGALCLNVPRRVPRTTPPVSATCKPPGVTRTEVVKACNEAKRTYQTGPLGLGGATSKAIPPCTAQWSQKWKKMANKPLDEVYVVSSNKKPWPNGDYCGGETTPAP